MGDKGLSLQDWVSHTIHLDYTRIEILSCIKKEKKINALKKYII